MDFRLTPEQTGFAQSLTELMTRADSVAVARSWAEGDTEAGVALWRRLAEQGVTALVVPEDDGGLGGTAVDLVVAFEVLGHQLAVGPWIESAAYLSQVLSGDDLAAVVGGAIATVVVPPLVPFALDADVAEKVFVPGQGGFETVAGSSTTGLRSVDTTRRLFDLPLSEGEGRGTSGSGALGDPVFDRVFDRAFDRAFDLAALACAAELLGCGERLLADSVDYVKQRKQYGRVIGSYQAIKHALADVRIALDFARPLVHGAALAVASDTTTASRDVSAAKVAAGDAAYLSARVALQVHGAIGYTAEFDLGLWINRVRALVGAWGGSGHHRARIADALAAVDG
jgi:alkylation response protein AidB-like acyl-CoA dehydrogenase